MVIFTSVTKKGLCSEGVLGYGPPETGLTDQESRMVRRIAQESRTGQVMLPPGLAAAPVKPEALERALGDLEAAVRAATSAIRALLA